MHYIYNKRGTVENVGFNKNSLIINIHNATTYTKFCNQSKNMYLYVLY